MVIAAAEAGKNILCQKPMALTLIDCDRMIEAVEKAGVKFMMAHQMRHDPANLKMKEIIQSGRLGKLDCYVAATVSLLCLIKILSLVPLNGT